MGLALLLQGCGADSYTGKLVKAEDELSSGKRAGESLATVPTFIPPQVCARRTIALSVDSILHGGYDPQEVRKPLVLLRKDPFVPRYLRVEAGYLLVLLDRLEEQKRLNERYVAEKERIERETRKELEAKYTAENDRLSKELDELKYKLQKIEEIHISTEKKRGIQ